MSVTAIAALLLLFLGFWNAPASSLGEVALREAVRRHALPASVRTVTNEDLPPSPERPAATVPPVRAPARTEDAPPSAAEAEAGAPPEVRDQQWWQSHMQQARAAVDRDLVLVAALESRVAALATDFVNYDDPAQRAVIQAERGRALAELDRMRKQLDADRQAVADLEEDARKAGVPPGWIRGSGGMA